MTVISMILLSKNILRLSLKVHRIFQRLHQQFWLVEISLGFLEMWTCLFKLYVFRMGMDMCRRLNSSTSYIGEKSIGNKGNVRLLKHKVNSKKKKVHRAFLIVSISLIYIFKPRLAQPNLSNLSNLICNCIFS